MAKSYLNNGHMSDEQLLQHFKSFMYNRTADMEDYVERCMKNTGDTEATSQQLCIINAINNLEAAICGTELDDLIITEFPDLDK